MEMEMEDLRIKLDDGDLVVRCHGEVLCQLTVLGGVKPIWRGGEVDDAPQIPASITVVCKIGLGLRPSEKVVNTKNSHLITKTQ